MKLFYTCYGSAHSSVTAANIHLGLLPTHRRATYDELCWQPMFDRVQGWEVGTPLFAGQDERGVEVYVLGLASRYRNTRHGLESFLALRGYGQREVRFEVMLTDVGVLMRVGGYTSRRLGLAFLGRPIVAYGAYLTYPRFVEHVRRVRSELHDLLETTALPDAALAQVPTMFAPERGPDLP